MSEGAEADSAVAIGGPVWRAMLRAALIWLERNAGAIDAINVYPVPDGDTGSNMVLTLRAAVEAAEEAGEESVGEAMAAAAQGALLGARGNSGVILSQWLRGLAEGCEGAAVVDGARLRAGLERAASVAVTAMSEPREGTMLSVAGALVREADAPTEPEGGPEAVLAEAVERAEAAVARTPEQLPLLAEAGVVDAGGRGLAVLLEGFRYGLRGEAPPGRAAASGAIDPAWLAGATARSDYGYCTEFTVEGEGLEAGRLRGELAGLGDSVSVAGMGSLLHVHLHTAEPEAAFACGARQGRVRDRKVEDIGRQGAALAARVGRGAQREVQGEGAAAGAVAVVAVASGAGFERLLRELGAAAVVEGGERKPSAQEILAAAAAAGAGEVIVLPNDAAVVAAAEQAAGLSESVGLRVARVTSLPAAVAALSAWDRGEDAAAAERRMAAAAAAVLCGAVTQAARATERPVRLREGQPFALLGEEIIGGAGSAVEALVLLAERMLAARPEGSLLTVYCGGEGEAGMAEAAGAALRAQAPAAVEVEVVIGGQRHYLFLVSLE